MALPALSEEVVRNVLRTCRVGDKLQWVFVSNKEEASPPFDEAHPEVQRTLSWTGEVVAIEGDDRMIHIDRNMPALRDLGRNRVHRMKMPFAEFTYLRMVRVEAPREQRRDPFDQLMEEMQVAEVQPGRDAHSPSHPYNNINIGEALAALALQDPGQARLLTTKMKKLAGGTLEVPLSIQRIHHHWYPHIALERLAGGESVTQVLEAWRSAWMEELNDVTTLRDPLKSQLDLEKGKFGYWLDVAVVLLQGNPVETILFPFIRLGHYVVEEMLTALLLCTKGRDAADKFRIAVEEAWEKAKISYPTIIANLKYDKSPAPAGNAQRGRESGNSRSPGLSRPSNRPVPQQQQQQQTYDNRSTHQGSFHPPQGYYANNNNNYSAPPYYQQGYNNNNNYSQQGGGRSFRR